MTITKVEPSSPILRMVSKAAEIDPDGAHELLRLGLYESLCEQVDAARPALQRELDAFVAKREATMRRALVRKFIDSRLAKEDTEEVVKAAELVSKTTANDQKHGWVRDLLGRFATKANDRAADADALTGAARGYTESKQRDTDDPFDKPRYSNLRATGAALSLLNDPTAQAAGNAARAIGGLGPEAERVLGNGIRRTAYRYRGTERLPDRTLKNEIKNGLGQIDPKNAPKIAALRQAEADAETRGRALAGRPFDKDRSSARSRTNRNPAVAIADYYESRGGGLSQDQKEMRVAGDIAANYLLNKLPSQESTAIAIAAGRVPPSQGVIIDADGDVVSEAMGYNGDHYVPFDLKNLRSLQGGQYVRTRAVGGPTTEDIYTGLLAGARQVQVVSQSGVFTLEFDPSLRGGRRYSDKARQMVGRYERILDAIDKSEKSGLYQVDITPAERRAIQQKYARDYSGQDLIDLVDRDVAQLRTEKSFKMLTDEEIETEAKRRLRPGDNKAELANLIAEVKDENRKSSVKRFQLDGDGYEAALKALQTEFPYFIRAVKRERLPDFVNTRGLQGDVRFSGATDQGYVAPSTKSTGLARSVTTSTKGVVHQRGVYDAAERPKAAPAAGEAQEGAAGAPAAPGGAAAPAGKPRMETKELNRKAASAFANLASIHPDLDFDPAVTPQLNEDEWAGQPAPRILHEAIYAGQRHKGGFAGYLSEMSEDGRRALSDALLDVSGVLGRLQMDPKEAKAITTSAGVLQHILDATLPFAQGDPLEYDPGATGRPLAFQGLPSPLDGVAEVDETIKHLRVHNPMVYDYVEAFSNDDGDADAVDTIDALLTSYGRENSQGNADRLKAAQLAFALARVRRQAANLEQIVGAPGKAPASQEEATRLSKRQLTWHRPGSPVATEFQKFLAQRR